MANVCERCKRFMSSHDGHASCPLCRMAAGECHLDIENPCNICGGWTSKQWGKLRRSVVDARARASQRGRQHWSAAFPRLEVWILSRPVSALAQGLYQKSLPWSVQQVLVVQTQNGVNMASGTVTTAPSTAPLPLTAGPSTIEPIVPIVAPLGAQDRPSVTQELRTRPVSFKELGRSLVRSRQCSLLQDMAPLLSTAPLSYAAMPAMLARPSYPMGYYGQGNQFPLMPNPN